LQLVTVEPVTDHPRFNCTSATECLDGDKTELITALNT